MTHLIQTHGRELSNGSERNSKSMEKNETISVKIPLTPEVVKLLFSSQDNENDITMVFGLKVQVNTEELQLKVEEFRSERKNNEILTTLKHDLRAFIAKNQIQEAIEALMDSVKPQTKTHNEVLVISAKFHRTVEHKTLQIITFNELDIAMSNIVNSLVHMVNNIEEEEIK